MPVVLMIEWDNAKDESRYEKYAQFTREQRGPGNIPLFQKMVEEGSVKGSGWTDNTGHLINWVEFETMEVFAKVWADEEWHKRWLQMNPLVDNLRFRLLRPSQTITEELTV